MLANAKNSELVADWLLSITDLEVQDAFRYLVGATASSPTLTGHAQWKGTIRDFRLHSSDGKQPFSFITNRESLLFYFRAPSKKMEHYSIETLRQGFEEVNVNARDEWTVKITSLKEARSLWSYLNSP